MWGVEFIFVEEKTVPSLPGPVLNFRGNVLDPNIISLIQGGLAIYRFRVILSCRFQIR